MAHKDRGSYWYDVLVGADQFGNALAGGNPDTSISARIGYNANYGTRNTKFWKVLEKIVNFTFEPVDGPTHCLDAYENDKLEDYEYYNDRVRKGDDVFKAILATLAVGFCLPISLILHSRKFIKGLFKK